MIQDIYTHEDWSKPENRISFMLFGLMPTIGDWLLSRLALPSSAVVYPCANVVTAGGSFRPDLRAVLEDGTALARIEVKTGAANEAQNAGYATRLPGETIKTICGRLTDPCDVSLEEIASMLREMSSEVSPQERCNMQYLTQAIEEVIAGDRRRATPRQPVPNDVLERPYVRRLLSQLRAIEPDIIVDGVPVPRNKIGIHSRGRGFSINLFTPLPADSVNVFRQPRSGDAYFPLIEHWRRYLVDRPSTAIGRLDELVSRMRPLPMKNSRRVAIDMLEQHLDELATVLIELRR